MITYETYHRIHAGAKRGLKPSQIAVEVGLTVPTVRRWLDTPNYHPRQARPVRSKLDPFKDTIVRWLEQHALTATQVYQRLVPMGFDGSYPIVKRYVRRVRPRPREAFLTLNFAPGQCAQLDWGQFGTVALGDTRRRLSFFVMVLCHSRQMYLEFTVSQSMEHFLACHERAFQFFGGSVRELMIDNLKSAVLHRPRADAPVFHPRYLDLAQHFGFTIKPCGVGRGNEKGIVENAVGYVKKNLLNGLEISDFNALRDHADRWLAEVANTRTHGQTRQRPVDLWQQERSHLQPLPERPFHTAVVKTVRVSNRFRITWDTNRYSVPAQYANRKVELHAYTDRLCVYSEQQLIARHRRCYDRYQDIEDPEHPKPLLAQRAKARDQKLLARFLTLAPEAEPFYRKLLDHRLNAMLHVRKIVALSELYARDDLARALADALAFAAYRAEYIANLLEQRARTPLDEPPPLQVPRAGDWLELDLDPPDLSIYNVEGSDDE